MPRSRRSVPRRRRGRPVGIDLAGSPARRTGFCALGPGLATATWVLGADDAILSAVRAEDPPLVAIDAPLSLPAGRRSLDVPSPPHFRACDLALRALGIPFFPVTLGPMRSLTRRGIDLAARLRRDGFSVIEAYPGGAQDVLGLPRKGAGRERLRRALVRRGFTGAVADPAISHDELDAIVCAFTAREQRAGRGWSLGDPAEGLLVLPRARPPPAPRRA